MRMKFVVYNPFRYVPFFQIENVGYTTIKEGNSEKEVEKIVIDSEKNTMIFDGVDKLEINKIPITLTSKAFFCSYEIFLSTIMFLWGLYLFFSTRTDIVTVILFLVGFFISAFACIKSKFLLANFLISLTAFLVMIWLYIFYKRLEIVYQHIGILAFSFFFIVSLLYRMVKKNNLLKNQEYWFEPTNQSGKRFFIVEKENGEISAIKREIIKRKSEINKDKVNENK